MRRWHLSTLGRVLASMIFCALVIPAAAAQAQTGNIYPDGKFAWSENAGWLNFRPTHGGVTVYADHLEGYAWAENIGWVRLGAYSGGGAYTYANTSAANYGVNNASGILSGYGWSENAGWINFKPTDGGVTINGEGKFFGYAWGENIGWVHFSNAAPEYHVATWGSDTTAPDTVIDSHPANPSDNASATFTFHGADNAGGSGIASFECSLDGGFVSCTSPQSYTGLSDGSHTFQVRAIDNAGNTDASPVSYTWVVDTAAPDTVIDSHPANPSDNSSATFTFHGADNAGGLGIASFECSLDGGFVSCASPQSYAGLSDGSHTFQVRAKDAAGNTDATPASYTWVVDTAAPNTAITNDPFPTGFANITSATFNFTGNDGSGTGVASFECKLDGGGFSSCTSPQSYSGLSDGSHTFQVRAIDKAGNADATPASYTWTVDTTSPTVFSITSIAGNPTNGSPIPVTITFSEPVCGFDSTTGVDLNVTNGTTSSLTSGSNGSTVYTFNLTPSGQGLVSFYLMAGSVYDGGCVTPLNYNSVNSATFSITFDTVSPTVDSFTATSPSTSLNIPITSFTASDTVGVTGYLITESATAPVAGDAGWSATALAKYTVEGTGSYTLYPWAKDGAGNVSAVFGAPPTVTVCYPTVTVANNADNGTGSLRRAIADSCDGGTITFGGNYTITLASELIIDKNLTIDGTGRSVTVDGDNNTRVFHVNAGITFNLNDLTIANGLAGADNHGGGGLWVDGTNLSVTTVNLSRVTFSNNRTDTAIPEGGGGLRSYQGTLALTDVTFADNQAQTGGGMSTTYGTAALTNVTFSGNKALESDPAGLGCGGLFSGMGHLTVTNATFSNNAGVNGGAFCQIMGGTTFTNVTFKGNGDAQTQSGGAMYNSGALTVYDSILWGNTAADGTQISNSPATVSDSVIQGGYAGGTNIITDDPLLGTIGDYGGLTKTIPLLPGSPAIDAGDAGSCPATDQRGVARGTGCDIGAFESRGFTLAISGGNNQSAVISTAFANALSVTVTADNASEPVNGGQVTFTAPASGASASITGNPATISGGSASVTAAANGTVGAYIITADTAGANQISFHLQNLAESVPTTTIPETTTTTTTTIPDNGTCALNIFPDNFSKLFAVFFPLQIFFITADNGTSFEQPIDINWETGAIDDLISFRLCSKLIFGFIFVQQGKFVDGDYSVTVTYGSPAKKACGIITLSE